MPSITPKRFPGGKNWTLLTLSALSALTGCANHKVVMLHSDPLGANLTIIKLMNGAPAGTVDVAKADPITKVTAQDLPFPADSLPTYQVTAKLDRYRDNSVIVAWDQGKEQTTDYKIPLTEYKRPIDSVRFDPTKAGSVWTLNAVVTQEMAYLQNLIEPNAVVTNQVQVTAAHDDATDYLNLAASPIADVLVYQKVEKRDNGTYSTRLFKRNTRSGLETALTSTPPNTQEYTPAFTYGGDAVVFSSDNARENPTLWQIQLNSGGSFIKSLTSTDSADYAPSVGQSLIVYNSFPTKALEPQICRCALDGKDAGYLGEGTCPQVSPDERQILFLRKGKGSFDQLWLMDKDGSNLRQLTQNNDYAIADPKWSPDGKWIAYSCLVGRDEDQQPESDIWIIASDGSGKNVQLTKNGSCDTAPAWDRNGTTIYFRSNRGGTWNIWKFDIRPAFLQ
jgi:dipeptidyl aminopeptidase/acylaminoacyl peptidase